MGYPGAWHVPEQLGTRWLRNYSPTSVPQLFLQKRSASGLPFTIARPKPKKASKQFVSEGMSTLPQHSPAAPTSLISSLFPSFFISHLSSLISHLISPPHLSSLISSLISRLISHLISHPISHLISHLISLIRARAHAQALAHGVGWAGVGSVGVEFFSLTANPHVPQSSIDCCAQASSPTQPHGRSTKTGWGCLRVSPACTAARLVARHERSINMGDGSRTSSAAPKTNPDSASVAWRPASPERPSAK